MSASPAPRTPDEEYAYYNDVIRRITTGVAVTEEDLKFHVEYQNRTPRSGLPVGAAIPDITLQDQSGAPRRLADLIGENGLVLSFARTVTWCPYCRNQLGEVRAARALLASQGVTVAAITPDPLELHQVFAREQGIDYPLLTDPDSAAIEAFGILNDNIRQEIVAQRHRMPFPGNFFIGPDGRVADKAFLPNFENRESVTVPAMKRLGVAAGAPRTEMRTADYRIEISLSACGSYPGNEVGLVCRLQPQGGRRLEPGAGGGSGAHILIEEDLCRAPLRVLSDAPDGEGFVITGVAPIRWSAPREFDVLVGLEQLTQGRLAPGAHALRGEISFKLQGPGRSLERMRAAFELPVQVLPDVARPNHNFPPRYAGLWDR